MVVFIAVYIKSHHQPQPQPHQPQPQDHAWDQNAFHQSHPFVPCIQFRFITQFQIRIGANNNNHAQDLGSQPHHQPHQEFSGVVQCQPFWLYASHHFQDNHQSDAQPHHALVQPGFHEVKDEAHHNQGISSQDHPFHHTLNGAQPHQPQPQNQEEFHSHQRANPQPGSHHRHQVQEFQFDHQTDSIGISLYQSIKLVTAVPPGQATIQEKSTVQLFVKFHLHFM